MNPWTKLSIDYANKMDYLDALFNVYPTIPEGLRTLDDDIWKDIEDAFKKNNKIALLQNLLSLELFPIKDSYVAYLKRAPDAILRNLATVERLYERLKEMGIDEIREKCSEPKETNRQIGPLFRRWLQKSYIAELVKTKEFLSSKKNAILDESENELLQFAQKYLDYDGDKRPDIIARFNQLFVIGEAKFLTDFGGHQNAQFEDAKNLLKNNKVKAVKVAILDGVLYIKGNNKMYTYLAQHKEEYNILSCLFLSDFLNNIK